MISTLSIDPVNRSNLCVHFYQYGGPPPVRVGSSTRKTLSSASRTIKIGKCFQPGSFPINYDISEIPSETAETSNLNSRVDLTMAAALTRRKYSSKKELLNKDFRKYEDWLISTPTSNLTSGRQTYDLLMDSNIPTPQAFERYLEILKANFPQDEIERVISPTYH